MPVPWSPELAAQRPPEPNEVHIAVGADESYAIGMAVCLHSALRLLDHSRRANVLILDGGLSAESRRRIERVISTARPGTAVVWHVIDTARFRDLNVSSWGSEQNYMRLAIPDLVHPDTDLALYLDSDILVRDDLSTLFDFAREDGSTTYAVNDYRHPTLGSSFGLDGCKEMGLDPAAPYFNSGVLLFDPRSWRDNSVADRTIETSQRFGSLFTYSDQDGLNVVLTSSWRPLDYRWNVMLAVLPDLASRLPSDRPSSSDEAALLLEDAGVIHYVGRRKPWIPGYRDREGGAFRRELRASGWFAGKWEAMMWALAYWLHPAWLRELARSLVHKSRLFSRNRPPRG